MTLAEVRRLLKATRQARKRSHGLTLDKVAAESGVDRAVIHRIESVDKYPNYNPELDTVLKIIGGLGLQPVEFFDTEYSQIGTQPLTLPQAQAEDPPSNLRRGGIDGVDRLVHSATHVHAVYTVIGNALIDAATQIFRHRDALSGAGMSIPPTSHPQSDRRKRGHRNR